MGDRVFASDGGRRFHETASCLDLLGGQLMNDGFKVFWLARNEYRRLHDAKPMTIVTAFGRGKEPCATCYPELRAALYRGNCEDDFGHEPVEIDGDLFCARCRTRYIDEYGERQSYPTLWPCISARTLGFAPPRCACESHVSNETCRGPA